VARNANGRLTKPPIHYRTGIDLDYTERANLCTFERAVNSSKGDGIGFSLFEDDPYCFIDLDHCLDEEHKLEPWATAIVERLKTYTEYSPSISGLHLLLKGKLPDQENHRKDLEGASHPEARIEIYDRARYMTITGYLLADGLREIRESQAELE
jgi:primase-polymerase (primpol)-like protein